MKEVTLTFRYDDTDGYKGHGNDVGEILHSILHSEIEITLEGDSVIKPDWELEVLEVKDVPEGDKYKMTFNSFWNYHWTCDQGIEIPEKHKEALIEDAEDRISEMIRKGYYQGELSTSVRYGKDVVPEEDEDDGLSYSGWWFYKRND